MVVKNNIPRMSKLRKYTDIDLRVINDEYTRVKGGILYRRGATVQVWWDELGKETWILPDSPINVGIAKANFREMKERWNE